MVVNVVEHSNLFDTLEHWVGLESNYLAQSFCLGFGDDRFAQLSPVLFSIYMLPLGHLDLDAPAIEKSITKFLVTTS